MMFRTTMLVAFSLASVSAHIPGVTGKYVHNVITKLGIYEGVRVEAAIPGGDPNVYYPGVFQSGENKNRNYVKGYYCTIKFDHMPPCCDEPNLNTYTYECTECRDPYRTGLVHDCNLVSVRKSDLETLNPARPWHRSGVTSLREGDVVEYGRKFVMNWTKAWQFDQPRKAAFLKVDPRNKKMAILRTVTHGEYNYTLAKPISSLRRPRSPTGAQPLETVTIEATEFKKQGFSVKEGTTVQVHYENPKTHEFEWCKSIFMRAHPGACGYKQSDMYDGEVSVYFFKTPSIWDDEEAESDSDQFRKRRCVEKEIRMEK